VTPASPRPSDWRIALSGPGLEDVRWLARFLVVETMADHKDSAFERVRPPWEELTELLQLVSAMTSLDLGIDYPEQGDGSPPELSASEIDALIVVGRRFAAFHSADAWERQHESAEVKESLRRVTGRIRAGIAALDEALGAGR
jgi:hypothetical protein